MLVAEDSTGSCSANGSGRASLPNEWLIAPTPVARGIGRYDRIEVPPDGRTLVSAWNDSTVSAAAGARDQPTSALTAGLAIYSLRYRTCRMKYSP